MQSWCKTWPLNGSSRIRVRLKLQQRHREACKSSRNPRRILKSFTEFGKSCENLSWNYCTSTPHRSETNGTAERAVRRVKKGTSVVLLQSGLNESWWAGFYGMSNLSAKHGMLHLSAKRHSFLSDGKTSYERRFGQPTKKPIIPFGSLVEYLPIIAKGNSQ